jgi:Protein of unknown function (DUF992)
MNIKAIVVTTFIGIPATLFAFASFAETSTKIGTLRCDVSAGIGLIITSNREVNCQFQPTRGRKETYRGNIRRFGLDVGVTTPGVLIWGVLAETRGATRGALAGEYVGPSAEITAGVGVGVNILVGGSGRSYSLQPVSVEGQLGVNLAAGVSDLVLVSNNRR